MDWRIADDARSAVQLFQRTWQNDGIIGRWNRRKKSGEKLTVIGSRIGTDVPEARTRIMSRLRGKLKMELKIRTAESSGTSITPEETHRATRCKNFQSDSCRKRAGSLLRANPKTG